MLQTQTIAAPAAKYAASSHVLPVVAAVGGLVALEYAAWKVWRAYRADQQKTADKQAELEQKVDELQTLCQTLKAAQDAADKPLKASTTAEASSPSASVGGKQGIFEKIINDNIAIRAAANV